MYRCKECGEVFENPSTKVIGSLFYSRSYSEDEIEYCCPNCRSDWIVELEDEDEEEGAEWL